MIEFVDIETDRPIDFFHNIKSGLSFAEGEEIIVEGKPYTYVRKATLFYRDTDGEKMVTNIYLKSRKVSAEC